MPKKATKLAENKSKKCDLNIDRDLCSLKKARAFSSYTESGKSLSHVVDIAGKLIHSTRKDRPTVSILGNVKRAIEGKEERYQAYVWRALFFCDLGFSGALRTAKKFYHKEKKKLLQDGESIELSKTFLYHIDIEKEVFSSVYEALADVLSTRCFTDHFWNKMLRRQKMPLSPAQMVTIFELVVLSLDFHIDNRNFRKCFIENVHAFAFAEKELAEGEEITLVGRRIASLVMSLNTSFH